MTTALAKRELTLDTWSMIEKIAPTMQKSRLFGVATTEQAASIMLKGYELGFSLTASFEFVQIIADKPTLSPRGALALIIQSGECDGLKISDNKDDKGNPISCTVWMKRKNGMEYTTSFTMEDARRADLIKPGSGWAKYPANMLRFRAIGFCADIVFSDIIGGMKRADELGADITPEGDVINTTWTVKPAQPVQPQPDQLQPSVMLQDLIAHYGAPAILEVNNNMIPQTPSEVVEVAKKLEERAETVETITVDAVKELAS